MGTFLSLLKRGQKDICLKTDPQHPENNIHHIKAAMAVEVN